MKKLTFIADQVYANIKNDILGDKFQHGEQLTVEAILARFNVCRSFALEALDYLADTGLVEKSGTRFYIRKQSKEEYLMMSRIKMIFINLSYALQKLQENYRPVCFDCLKSELIKIKCATYEQNETVFFASIKAFYGCMIEYTEMPLLEKNIDYLIDMMTIFAKQKSSVFFTKGAKEVISYLRKLIELLERNEYDGCRIILQRIYANNIQLLFD